MQTTLSQSPRTELGSWLQVVAEQVSELRFGVVQITVHDTRVVQIERTERFRLKPNGAMTPDVIIPADQKPGGNPATQPTDQTPGGTLR